MVDINWKFFIGYPVELLKKTLEKEGWLIYLLYVIKHEGKIGIELGIKNLSEKENWIKIIQEKTFLKEKRKIKPTEIKLKYKAKLISEINKRNSRGRPRNNFQTLQ